MIHRLYVRGYSDLEKYDRIKKIEGYICGKSYSKSLIKLCLDKKNLIRRFDMYS